MCFSKCTRVLTFGNVCRSLSSSSSSSSSPSARGRRGSGVGGGGDRVRERGGLVRSVNDTCMEEDTCMSYEEEDTMLVRSVNRRRSGNKFSKVHCVVTFVW